MRALVAVSALLAVAGCGRVRRLETGDPSVTAATVPSVASSLPPKQDIPLPPLEQLRSTMVPVASTAPAALAASPTALWVQSHRSDRPQSHRPHHQPSDGRGTSRRAGCGDITVGAGAVWQTGCGVSPGLIRVDDKHTP